MKKPTMHLRASLIATAVALGLAGCGGGTSQLSTDVGTVNADFQVIEIATGVRQSRSAVPDLATNSAYKTTHLVFRAVAAGTTTIGQTAGSFGAQTGDGESATSATLPRFYVGVFEVTQGQWARLGGSDTWTAVTTTLVGPSAVVAEKPAFGLSWSGITTTLSAYNSGKTISLALPSDAQWEKACRAGSSSLFAWGDARDDATVNTYAQVWETSAGALGPRAVGSKTANAGILYDMHGNVWEWTSSQYVRGGSWRDTLPQARAANRHDLDIDTNHPLVGARLVLSL